MREVQTGAPVDAPFARLHGTLRAVPGLRDGLPVGGPVRPADGGGPPGAGADAGSVPWWQRAAYRLLGHHRPPGRPQPAGAVAQRCRLVPARLTSPAGAAAAAAAPGAACRERRRRLAVHRVRHGRLAAPRPPGGHRGRRGVAAPAWPSPGPGARLLRRPPRPRRAEPAGPPAGRAGHGVHAGSTPRSWSTRPAAGRPSRTTATWSARRRRPRFSARVFDVHEWLAGPHGPSAGPGRTRRRRTRGRAGSLPPAPRAAAPRRRPRRCWHLTSTWSSSTTRAVCCGAGGAYSALHPELAGPIRTAEAGGHRPHGLRRGGQRQPGLLDVAGRRRRRGAPSHGDRGRGRSE